MTSAPKLPGRNERIRSDIGDAVNAPRGNDKPWGHGWRLAGLLALAILPGCATTGHVHVKDTTHTFDTVVIDAGHGGHDDGARSRWGGREKVSTLAVAQKLEPKLRAAGFKTVMTRRDDTFIPLDERAQISNRQENAIFVSIHFNHSRSRKIRGTEVYYGSAVSRPIAQEILANVAALPGGRSRFTKSANFRVLRNNKYPAVLVEGGYLSNRSEGASCATGKHQERVASAIAGAIIHQRRPVAPVVAAPPTDAPNPAGTPAPRIAAASDASAGRRMTHNSR